MTAKFKNRAWIAVAIFLLAFPIRLIFAEEWSGWPYGLIPHLDAKSYDLWAKEIAGGQILRNQAFYQSPLYPYFLGLIYKILGPNPFYISIVQSVLDASTCVLMALIALEIRGWAAALFAGTLSALYRPMVFFSAPIMKETLSLFVLALGLYFYLRARHSNSPWRWFTSGLLIGLAVIGRSNLGIVAIAMALVLIWPFSIDKYKNCAQFLIAMAIPILMTATHNWYVSNAFVPVTYSGGFNFFVGYHQGASAFNVYPLNVATDPSKEERDVTRIAEQAAGRNLDPNEVSSYWYGKAWQWVLSNPASSVRLFAEKLLSSLGDYEPPDNYDQNFIVSTFPSILRWMPITFGILVALFGASLIVLWRDVFEVRLLGLFSAAYLISIAMFYLTDRYRLPMVIFMFPVAGAGLSEILSIERRPIKVQAWLLATFVTVITFSFWVLPGDKLSHIGYNQGLLASLYSQLGRDREAVDAIYPALSADAGGVTQQAIIHSAESLERLGNVNGANAMFKLAIDRFPEDGLSFHNYGRFKLDQGEVKSAQELFQKAAKVSPWLWEPYVGLALASIRLGDKTLAIHAIESGERLKPDAYEFRKLRELVSSK